MLNVSSGERNHGEEEHPVSEQIKLKHLFFTKKKKEFF